MKMEVHVIRYEGVQACQNGIPIESNPYAAEGNQGDLADEWDYGWRITANSNSSMLCPS